MRRPGAAPEGASEAGHGRDHNRAGAWEGREAARRIRRRDRAVARYVRHSYRVDWGDPLLYHLVLNAASLGEEGAVRLILRAAPAADDPPTSAPHGGGTEAARVGGDACSSPDGRTGRRHG